MFGAFTCLFSTVGFMNAFGVFQEYYTHDLLSSNAPSTIAWIGAVSIFFLFSISAGAGAMLDAFGPKVSITTRTRQWRTDDIVSRPWSTQDRLEWSSR